MLTLVFLAFPETARLTLEDMDAVFGDRTSMMPTPVQDEALPFARSSGTESPVPSMQLDPDSRDSEHIGNGDVTVQTRERGPSVGSRIISLFKGKRDQYKPLDGRRIE